MLRFRLLLQLSLLPLVFGSHRRDCFMTTAMLSKPSSSPSSLSRAFILFFFSRFYFTQALSHSIFYRLHTLLVAVSFYFHFNRIHVYVYIFLFTQAKMGEQRKKNERLYRIFELNGSIPLGVLNVNFVTS